MKKKEKKTGPYRVGLLVKAWIDIPLPATVTTHEQAFEYAKAFLSESVEGLIKRCDGINDSKVVLQGISDDDAMETW